VANALRRSEDRLRGVIDTLSEGVVVCDPQGRFVSWNAAALALHGLEREHEWPRGLAELASIFELSTAGGRVVPHDEWPIPRILRGERLRDCELRIRRLDIEWSRVFRYGGAVVVGDGGEPTAVLTISDVTERVSTPETARALRSELEERLQGRIAALEAANRDLESFSYSLSHDLRQPLRAINGFSEIALRDYGALLPDEGRHLLQTIRQNGARMSALVEDMLEFSRLGRRSLKPRRVDMNAVVERVIEDLAGASDTRPAQIRLGDLPPCEADRSLIEQVWSNLLSNAFKYSRGRSPAIVEVGCERSEHAVYFVRDNGVGFDMRSAQKLFRAFQRLHGSEFEGTGVGLAIVERIVDRHGGRVWAESEPGIGTTLRFTLSGGAER
jgi:signal transduction histidine kinase